MFTACEVASYPHQPVGTYVRASTSEGQAKDYQYVMFIDVRQRPNTVGLLVGADARTSVPTVRMCEELMLDDCSLGADEHTCILWCVPGPKLNSLNL